jgi:hypothetical protein
MVPRRGIVRCHSDIAGSADFSQRFCVQTLRSPDENDASSAPLFDALAARPPFAAGHLGRGRADPGAAPSEGVAYDPSSPSSHARDHRFVPKLTRRVLGWPEPHGRRLVADNRPVGLEVDELARCAALAAHG